LFSRIESGKLAPFNQNISQRNRLVYYRAC
jgi:hypothetical protein